MHTLQASNQKVNVAGNLTAAQLADLRKSGLTDETIAENGLSSLDDPTRIRHALNWSLAAKETAAKLGPCLAIPYRTVSGRFTGYVRLKPTTPRPDRGKYESPAGSKNRPYFPVRALPAIADATAPLVITEGEKKALAATQAGLPTIGMSGVWNWQRKRKSNDEPRRLIPELGMIRWKDREVTICFDSDAADNDNIVLAEQALAAVLKERGAVVKIARLPCLPDGSKCGVDDYYVHHGAQAVLNIPAQAVAFVQSEHVRSILPPAPSLEQLRNDLHDLRHNVIHFDLMDFLVVDLETLEGRELPLPLEEAERRRIGNLIAASRRLHEATDRGEFVPILTRPCERKVVRCHHNNKKGLFRIAEYDCGGWPCPACRVKLAAKWKLHLEGFMSEYEHLYYGEIDAATEYRKRRRKNAKGQTVEKLEEFCPAWNRTYKAMVRSAKKGKRALNFRRVSVPGKVLLISTEPFPTKTGEPAKKLSADSAIRINQMEVDAIETERPISVSEGWTLPQKIHKPQGWSNLGTCADELNGNYSLASVLTIAQRSGLKFFEKGPYGLFVAQRLDAQLKGGRDEAKRIFNDILNELMGDVPSILPIRPRGPCLDMPLLCGL